MTAAPWATHHAGGRWLAFRNDSGETCPAFGIIRVIGIATIEGRIIVKGGKPNTTFQRLYFVNGPSDVPDGGFGSCTDDFPTLALYDTGATAAVGESWGAKPSEWKLFQHRPGFTVLSTTSDSPAGRVLVAQSPIGSLVATTTQSIASHSTGTAEIKSGAAGAEADAGFSDITVSTYFLSSGSIPTATRVMVHWINNQWYVGTEECA